MHTDLILDVQGLSKHYATFKAVDNLSFAVEAGEIVGFLGPNGAGKSTTMRMLTGFIEPTAGTARVAGFDITTHRPQVQESIGYLPESSPLYPEMNPYAFLDYRASLRGAATKQRRRRLAEVAELVGIEDHLKVPIAHLSKGYRQRVALADALFHHPRLVILDEPTSGLDPAQITEFRRLIKNLVPQTTVLLSTHILQEVEAICTKVVIIKEGRLVVSSTPAELVQQTALAEPIRVECSGIAAADLAALDSIDGITDLQHSQSGDWIALEIHTESNRDIRPEISRALTQRGATIRELHRREVTLEDIVLATLGAQL